MNNQHINNAVFRESIQQDATDNCTSIAKEIIQNCHLQIKQGTTEIDTNSHVAPKERKRVYLHSIGRFSNLKKLQMGTYGD